MLMELMIEKEGERREKGERERNTSEDARSALGEAVRGTLHLLHLCLGLTTVSSPDSSQQMTGLLEDPNPAAIRSEHSHSPLFLALFFIPTEDAWVICCGCGTWSVCHNTGLT